MQHANPSVRQRILQSARDCFLRDGYAGAAMRDIARGASVGVGNIYHYYPSKDALFCAVVRPLTAAIEAMLHDHHGASAPDVREMFSAEYLRRTTDEYLTLLRHAKGLLHLLLFRSQGSSLEGYSRVYASRAAVVVRRWLSAAKAQQPGMKTDVSDFFIRLHCLWMFMFFEEVLSAGPEGAATDQLVDEYIRFEIRGWQELLHISEP